MTKEQEAHLLSIKQSFDIMVDGKYRKGQMEHRGDLFSYNSENLVDRALEEAIDQVVYLMTLRDKIREKNIYSY